MAKSRPGIPFGMGRRGWIVFLGLALAGATAEAQEAPLRGHVADENGLPVDGAEVVLLSPEGQKQTAHSDGAGNFEIPALSPASYRATVTKPGFFLLKDQLLELKEGPNEVSFSLSHEYEVHESVQVIAGNMSMFR